MAAVSDLIPIAEGVYGAETRFRLMPGVWLPLRMTVLSDEDGVTLIAPVEISDGLAEQIAALGPVRRLIAPNRLHYAFLAAASERFDQANVFGAEGLSAKVPGLAIDHDLQRGSVGPYLEAWPIAGATKLSESALLHKPSKTLIVTDLVFNIREATGLSKAVLAMASRALGRVEQSRLIRGYTNDREAAGASVEEILKIPFDRLVVAHGEVVTDNARGELSAATWWMRGKKSRPTSLSS